MARKKMEKISANDLNYFWLEIEMKDTDKIVKEISGGRIRMMMYPDKSVGMGMEFKLSSDFLRLKTEKGNWKRGWPCGFVRIVRNDMSLLRHYLGVFKGTGRQYATSCHLKGVL